MKDGTTHLAYKPEHAVDLDTGRWSRPRCTQLMKATPPRSRHLGRGAAQPDERGRAAPSEIPPSAWPTRDTTPRGLDGPGRGPWKTRIAEPQRQGVARWHGDTDARRAVYNNRARLRSEVGKQAMRERAELVERSFAHILDRGGLRRTWLRGRENVHKRYLIHVARHNLGLLMRLLIGAGTPKEAVARGWCLLILLPTGDGAIRGSPHHSRRPQRHPSSDRREHALDRRPTEQALRERAARDPNRLRRDYGQPAWIIVLRLSSGKRRLDGLRQSVRLTWSTYGKADDLIAGRQAGPWSSPRRAIVPNEAGQESEPCAQAKL